VRIVWINWKEPSQSTSWPWARDERNRRNMLANQKAERKNISVIYAKKIGFTSSLLTTMSTIYLVYDEI
jgi:hypothetical protein